MMACAKSSSRSAPSLLAVAVALLLAAVTQLDHETYDVLWKIPAIDEATTLKVKPQFPDGTEALTQVRSTFSRGITVQRWRIRVPDGLDGKAIVFSQLSETRIDVLARLVRLDGTVQLERILPVHPSFVGRPSLGPLEVVTTYTILGIEHILSGFDHLLFVLALVLLVPPTRRLLVTITAFTAAHSLTLAGATLGWVHVPGPPVEASIALSIVFVASEIVHMRQGRASVTQSYPWLVAFTFRAAARIRLCRRAGGGRVAAVVDPDRFALLQCWRRDWAVDVCRCGPGRWLARGTAASISPVAA